MGETKKEILARLKTIESKLDTIMHQMNSQNPAEDRTMIDLAMAMQVTGLARQTITILLRKEDPSLQERQTPLL